MTNNDTWYDIRGDKLVLSKSMGVDIYYFDNPITMDISVADTSLDFLIIFSISCVLFILLSIIRLNKAQMFQLLK